MITIDEGYIDTLARMLRSGPLIIGESHDQLEARFAVYKLIKAGAVSIFSVESPIAPANMSRGDGTLRDPIEFSGKMSCYANPHITVPDLIKTAAKKGVRICCHDMPAARSDMNFHANPNNLEEYPNYASSFLPERLKKLPGEINMKNLVGVRNEYSAKYLKTQFGAGVRILHGLVLLVGSDHTVPRECNGASRTIQSYLGISSDRVIVLDEKTAMVAEDDDED